MNAAPAPSALSRGPIANALASVRAALFLGITFILIFLVGLFIVPLAAFFDKPRWLKAPCYCWIHILFPLFRIPVRVLGAEHLADPRPRLLIANHQSFLDIMLMMGWVRWPSFLAKKEIQSWPWFGWAMKVLRCVFVDRNDRNSRNAVGNAVKASMAEGIDFCIFAEGTRSPNGELLPFRHGAFQIAVDSGAYVTPVVLDPTWRVLNKKGFRLWPEAITISVLPPIDCAAIGKPDRKILSDMVEKAIRAELARIRSMA